MHPCAKAGPALLTVETGAVAHNATMHELVTFHKVSEGSLELRTERFYSERLVKLRTEITSCKRKPIK